MSAGSQSREAKFMGTMPKPERGSDEMVRPGEHISPPMGAMTAVYFRIVNLTFGGGNPTMAALERELVERRQWLEPRDYGLVYGLARLTPGTNLVAFCAGTAWIVRRWSGAVFAVLAATVPSSMAVVLLAAGYDSIKGNHTAKGAIAGALAAAVGIMIAASWNLLKPVVRRGSWMRAVIFATSAAVLTLGLSLTPIQVLALAALGGALWRGANA